MIDRKLEKKIEKLKEFCQAWTKFNEIYTKMVRRGSFTREDEELFISERNVIKRKYEELSAFLEIKKISEYADPIHDILHMQNVFSASDSQDRRTRDNFDSSILFLKNLLRAFEEKRNRVNESIGIIYFLNKLFTSIWFIIIAVLCAAIAAYFALIRFIITK